MDTNTGEANPPDITAAEHPNLLLAVPFFSVSDMDRSLAFYIDGLGFAIKTQWTPRDTIEWCWLQRDGVALMLQVPPPDHPVSQTEGKPGLGVSICFQCRDSLTLYHEFLNRGLTPGEPCVGNGLWVVSVADPDGYHLEFNSPTDVPEETTYSEWKKTAADPDNIRNA